jgi:hypothetical protein
MRQAVADIPPAFQPTILYLRIDDPRQPGHEPWWSPSRPTELGEVVMQY